MNFQLVTEAPSWMLILCLLAGFAYALVLYRKETTFSGVATWVTWTMAILRFFAVTFLCVLLLSPLVKTLFRQVERPLIVFLQDQSQSITSVTDSQVVKKDYLESLNALKKDLESDFDVRVFGIGEHVKESPEIDFKDKISDLSEPVDELKSRFTGRNLGAIILSSDGIFNKGTNPLYTYSGLRVPVYTIGMGDTTVRKDLIISRVNHNKTAFSGNTFPVEITLDARQCNGQEILLTILKGNDPVLTKPITITSNRYNMLFPLFLEAGAKGMSHYVVKVSKLDGEISHINNQRDFFIETIDSRQQVLVIANSPHPDIAVLKSLLESNPNYQVKTILANEFDGKTDDINLAILHQLPSITQGASEIIQKLQKEKIPVLYILGAQTSTGALNKLGTGVSIEEQNGNNTEIMAEPATDFPYFTMEEEHLRRIRSFPPLVSPFGDYSIVGPVQVLLYQRIGSVKTDMPLLLFNEQNEQKTAVLAGEGIWKWKLREYSDFNSSEGVTALLTKTIQYLATTEKKKPFRVFFKNSYSENEPVIMDAEFYNESGEPVNTNEATITILDENSNKYPFTFSRTGKAYTLQAGYLPVGSYSFTASTVAGNKSHIETGNFTVNALQAELTETIANHQLLNALSEKTGGRFFLPASIRNLATAIKERDDIRPVSFTQKKLDEVINLKWVFALLLFILSIEWFMRKRNGGY